MDDKRKDAPVMTQGSRFNEGKLLFECIPPEFEAALAAVLTSGAKKYDKYNWHKGFPFDELYGSLRRHLNAFMDPAQNDLDDESGLPHLSHAAANIMFMIYFTHHKERYEHFDNRIK